MGFFTKMAVSAIMSTSHPEIDRRQCWNLQMHKDRCTNCIDICPKGDKIFKRPGMIQDWAACTDCGLCVSACRSRCIRPSGEQVQKDCAPADSHNDTIWIGCEQSQRQNDVLRDCVGAFSWEQLAYLALNKKLVLDLTPCGECENEACAENLRRTLQRLIEFFGEQMFAVRVSLAYEPEEHPYTQKELNRRELMDLATSSSKSSTRRLLGQLPALQEQGSHANEFRLLLNERMKLIRDAASTPIRYSFYLPVVKDTCYGCGKCERACKAGALKLQDGEDGITRMVITPWKCSECGSCVESCTTKAMDPLTLRPVTSLGPVIVAKFKKRLCAECGKPIPFDNAQEVCHVCRMRRQTQKRREEAEERRRQREAEKAAREKAETDAAVRAKFESKLAAAEAARAAEAAPAPQAAQAAPAPAEV